MEGYPLHWAAAFGNLIGLEFLFEKESYYSLAVRSPSLHTPLWVAAANCHWDCYLGSPFSSLSFLLSFFGSYFPSELLHRGANQYIGTKDGSFCADFFLSLSTRFQRFQREKDENFKSFFLILFSYFLLSFRPCRTRRSHTKNTEREKIIFSLPWSGSSFLKKIYKMIKEEDTHVIQTLKGDKKQKSEIRGREIFHYEFAVRISACMGKLSLLYSLLTDSFFPFLSLLGEGREKEGGDRGEKGEGQFNRMEGVPSLLGALCRISPQRGEEKLYLTLLELLLDHGEDLNGIIEDGEEEREGGERDKKRERVSKRISDMIALKARREQKGNTYLQEAMLSGNLVMVRWLIQKGSFFFLFFAF